MPSTTKSTLTDQASDSNSAGKTLMQKWLERSLMLIALIGTLVVIVMYRDLIMRYLSPPLAKSAVYGKWVEQNVPSYAREEFILSAKGVTVHGSVVATDFSLDEKTLSYKVGSSIRRFDFVDQHHTEIKLNSHDHYLPVFHLEGRSHLKVL